jgi:uncharacterized RDD family membrane protein YckC
MLSAFADRRKLPMDRPVIDNTLPAPLWRRLAGLVYDLFAVVAVVAVTVMLCLLLTLGQLDYHAWWYRSALLLAVAAYFLLSWLRGGQTLGMRPWGIRLTARDGTRPGLARAVLRFAVAALPLLLLALAHATSTRVALLAPLVAWAVFFAVALFDRRRRALHDMVAGTELRRFARPRPAATP